MPGCSPALSAELTAGPRLDNEAERTDELRRKRELLESVPGMRARLTV
jgi:hypothetical protein